jgi:hypothetical protein
MRATYTLGGRNQTVSVPLFVGTTQFNDQNLRNIMLR